MCPVGPEDGKIYRYRTKNEHQCGGVPCQGDPKETRTCHIVDIMKGEITALYDKVCNLLDCQHGGVCHEGVCICQPGYHGTSCEKLRKSQS